MGHKFRLFNWVGGVVGGVDGYKYGFIVNTDVLRSLESLGKSITVGRVLSVNYFTVYYGIQMIHKTCGPLVFGCLGFFITENYSFKFKRYFGSVDETD